MREIRMSGLTRERAALGFAHAPSLLYWLISLGCGGARVRTFSRPDGTGVRVRSR